MSYGKWVQATARNRRRFMELQGKAKGGQTSSPKEIVLGKTMKRSDKIPLQDGDEQDVRPGRRADQAAAAGETEREHKAREQRRPKRRRGAGRPRDNALSAHSVRA